MQKTPMTVAGAEQLRKELDQLKSVERPQIISDIAEARAHGDLRENAEYHAAKEEQGMVEARIRDIEQKLSNANIIDPTKLQHTGRITFGATVNLVNLDSSQEVTYTLVGDDEADLKINKLSINSPLARAIVTKKIGDIVEVTTPAGIVTYEINNINYI